MKGDRWNILLLAGAGLSGVVCLAMWPNQLDVLLFISAIPFFCLQLLVCRMSRRRAVRLAPILPVAALLGMAVFYLVRDSGWDRLAALVLGLGSIAPAAGIALGWGVWRLCRWKRRGGAAE